MRNPIILVRIDSCIYILNTKTSHWSYFHINYIKSKNIKFCVNKFDSAFLNVQFITCEYIHCVVGVVSLRKKNYFSISSLNTKPLAIRQFIRLVGNWFENNWNFTAFLYAKLWLNAIIYKYLTLHFHILQYVEHKFQKWENGITHKSRHRFLGTTFEIFDSILE